MELKEAENEVLLNEEISSDRDADDMSFEPECDGNTSSRTIQ
jgi:hypothetical protein